MFAAASTPKSTFAPEAVVIFEILSPSSAAFDLGGENMEYQALPSLRRYVVLHRSQAAAAVFRRDDDGAWPFEFLGPEGVLHMPEVEIDLPLAEIYDGVEFA